MKLFAAFLIVFGLIVIANPEILAYLLGWFFVFIGLNMLIVWSVFSKWKKESFVKFGDYKIFK